MIKKCIGLVVLAFLFSFAAFAQDYTDTLGWDYSNGAYYWAVESADGDLIPGTDNNVDIGSSSAEIADIYVDGIIYADYITIGDAGAEDTTILFDGNAQDFHIGSDDTADDLVIGVGSALGTTTAISVDENTDVTVDGNLVTEGALDIGTLETFTDSDATPDVSDGSYFITNTTTFTITDFDGTGIVAGQVIVVESAGAITYDVDGTPGNLKGGTTNIVTADGDLTSWIYNGTDWLLISFMDLSDNLA